MGLSARRESCGTLGGAGGGGSFNSLYPVLGFPCNIAGIITSSIAVKQIKRNPGQGGRGMAIAGLVCSIISTVIALLVLTLIAMYVGAFH
jgi:hypothetical protein